MSAPTPNLFGGYSNLRGPWPSPDDQAWPQQEPAEDEDEQGRKPRTAKRTRRT